MSPPLAEFGFVPVEQAAACDRHRSAGFRFQELCALQTHKTRSGVPGAVTLEVARPFLAHAGLGGLARELVLGFCREFAEPHAGDQLLRAVSWETLGPTFCRGFTESQRSWEQGPGLVAFRMLLLPGLVCPTCRAWNEPKTRACWSCGSAQPKKNWWPL